VQVHWAKVILYNKIGLMSLKNASDMLRWSAVGREFFSKPIIPKSLGAWTGSAALTD